MVHLAAAKIELLMPMLNKSLLRKKEARWREYLKNTAPGSHGMPPDCEASIKDATCSARLSVLAWYTLPVVGSRVSNPRVLTDATASHLRARHEYPLTWGHVTTPPAGTTPKAHVGQRAGKVPEFAVSQQRLVHDDQLEQVARIHLRQNTPSVTPVVGIRYSVHAVQRCDDHVTRSLAFIPRACHARATPPGTNTERAAG
jgi:hypothetical protein